MLAHNGYVYETFGISKRFSIKQLQRLLNVPLLKSTLSRQMFYLPCWRFVVYFFFNFSHFVALPLSPCVGVGKFFCRFWTWRGLVRSVNVLDYEVLANKLFYNFVQMFQISFSLHHSSSAIRVRQIFQYVYCICHYVSQSLLNSYLIFCSVGIAIC
jgi:hypothetical protein